MRPIRVAVVEDEPLALQRATRLLQRDPAVELVGTATNAIDATRLMDETNPDVVLLDIEIPGESGLKLAENIRHSTAVIFVTAYQEYAVQAFDVEAVDYLVKPIESSRVTQALARARRWLEANDAQEPVLFSHVGSRTRAVDVAEVEYFEARDDYVAAFKGGRALLISTSMKELEKTLPSSSFLRVHRSIIVNVRFVHEFVSHPGDRLRVLLKSGKQVLTSRRRASRVRSFLRARGSNR